MDKAHLQFLLDRQDIADCLTRFSRGLDRLDRDIFFSAFHDDAEIAAGPFVGGPVELCDWAFSMHAEHQHMTQHALLNHTADIAGNVAHCETYYMFIAHNADESLWQVGGRYIDRLEKRGGQWQIALRTNAVEWSANAEPMPLPFAAIPDIDVNGKGARSPEDISYIRPLTNQRDRQTP